MLIGKIREKRTNLKTDDLEYAMIERYIISLKIINKNKNEIDNEINFSESSGACFRCGNKFHKYNKCNEAE